jgi:hypothetical protein
VTSHDDLTSDDAAFDDAAHHHLRALLAEARVGTPVPEDVAARLDATLADLTSARADRTDDVVVPLRRRSRVAPRLLAAAAVVVLLGAGAVGLDQVLDGSTSADDSKAATADSAREAPSSAVPESASGAKGGAGANTGSAAAGSGNLGRSSAQIPAFASASFARDAERFLAPDGTNLSADAPGYLDSTGDFSSPTAPSPADGAPQRTPAAGVPDQLKGLSLLDRALASKACHAPAGEAGRRVPIRLDGNPAVLVIGPLKDGSRLVRAWSCDGGAVLASAAVDR